MNRILTFRLALLYDSFSCSTIVNSRFRLLYVIHFFIRILIFFGNGLLRFRKRFRSNWSQIIHWVIVIITIVTIIINLRLFLWHFLSWDLCIWININKYFLVLNILSYPFSLFIYIFTWLRKYLLYGFYYLFIKGILLFYWYVVLYLFFKSTNLLYRFLCYILVVSVWFWIKLVSLYQLYPSL